MPNFIEKFIDHQIGYVYKEAASEIEANQSEIVTLLTPLAGQGASALKQVVNQVLGKTGATGITISAILDTAIDKLTATELGYLATDVPGFVTAAVAKLNAHAAEMLAA